MFRPEPLLDATQLHPRALAYLGDAVYELWVRNRAVQAVQSGQSEALHAFGVRHANAAFQGELLTRWQPHLSEAELEMVRRGRNVGVSKGRRSDHQSHRVATGFEALVGFLYLSDPDRLAFLLASFSPASESETR